MNAEAPDDRWLRPDLARFVAVVILAMVCGLLTVQFASNREGGTSLGPHLGADYAEFYAVGTLLNREPASRLYDLGLQDEILHQTLPGLPLDEHLPFVYPPFLAPLFQPLARLPYARSFGVWLAVSLGSFAASVGLMLRPRTGLDDGSRRLAWLLALSFVPFSMECWMGGQLSSLGCLAVAGALTLRQAGRPFLAGLALAILLYKPTLVVILAPLMVIGRRWWMVAGFAVGAGLLAAISLIVAGESTCLDFVGLMAGYGQRGGSVGQGFKTIKYVDLRAFLRLLGVENGVVSPLAMLLGLPALGALVLAWSKGDRGPKGDLAWSAALCWTPILNVYGPVYDVSIVVPGLILAAGALRPRAGEPWPLPFRRFLAVLYLSALVSPAMAKGLGFQPLTLALAAMGVYLIKGSLGRSGNGCRSGDGSLATDADHDQAGDAAEGE